MNLTWVKYQDSCIFIALNGSQNGRENEAFLKKIRSVYVVYKIKAFDLQVGETIIIGKKDLLEKEEETILRFELNQLQNPKECEIEIVSLKINYLNGKVEELKIKRTFSFLEIRSFDRIDFSRKEPSKKSTNKKEKKLQKKPQSAIALKSKPAIKLEELFEETKITPGGFTIIEEITPISTIVEKLESKIEHKMDAQTKKLDMDINKICYEIIDLLLSNLPLPELAEEYRASNAMVKSIHRYIDIELLQNEPQGGEST